MPISIDVVDEEVIEIHGIRRKKRKKLNRFHNNIYI